MSVLDNLPFGLNPEDFIVLMAALTATVVLLLIWSAMIPPDTGTERARNLAKRRDAMKAEAVTSKRRKAVRTMGLMREVVSRLKLMRNKQGENLHWKLARAGFRTQDAIIAYLFFKAVMPIAIGGAAFFLLFVVNVYSGSMQMRLVFAGAAVAFGLFAADLYLKNSADKRRQCLQRALPDGLDLMVICAEAGLSLDAAMSRVARELGTSFAELSDEFALTGVELGFLPERRMALGNLSGRTDLPGIRAMVGTLMQSERYGTPLAQSLRVLAAELRMERMMKAEEKAARLPATLTVPMILFILPPLFIVLIGPAILSVADAMSGMRV